MEWALGSRSSWKVIWMLVISGWLYQLVDQLVVRMPILQAVRAEQDDAVALLAVVVGVLSDAVD